MLLFEHQQELHMTIAGTCVVQTFEEADILRDGKIHPEEWQTFVHKNPSIINYMTLPVLKELTEKYPSFRDIAGL